MKQSRVKLAKAIADRTLRDGLSRQLSREIAAYLLSERRTSDLDSVLRDVQADWAAAGHVSVLASSAYPLTATVKTDIEHQIRQLYPGVRSITVNEVRDPDVVGGVRLSFADQRLDLSVRAQLNKFKQLTTTGRD